MGREHLVEALGRRPHAWARQRSVLPHAGRPALVEAGQSRPPTASSAPSDDATASNVFPVVPGPAVVRRRGRLGQNVHLGRSQLVQAGGPCPRGWAEGGVVRQRQVLSARHLHGPGFQLGRYEVVQDVEGAVLSCASMAFCQVVNGDLTVSWDGRHWSTVRRFPPSFYPTISCPAAGLCVAVDGPGYASTGRSS